MSVRVNTARSIIGGGGVASDSWLVWVVIIIIGRLVVGCYGIGSPTIPATSDEGLVAPIVGWWGIYGEM